MFETFMLRALLGGVGVAIIAGPLGAMVLWRSMAQFGGALAHSALLGVAFSFYLSINPVLGIIAVAVFFSFMLFYMQNEYRISNDALLSIMSHSFLAVGLVLIGFLEIPINLESYLFGDILTIQQNDIILISTAIFMVLGLLYYYWDDFLISSLSPDLAIAGGVNVRRVNIIFMLMVSVVVALSIKIVGILLITSLLVIPAAVARKLAKTPVMMAGMASLIGIIVVIIGLLVSYYGDVMASAAIVMCAFIFYLTIDSIIFLGKWIIKKSSRRSYVRGRNS